jgi:hypothetical protein
MIQDNARSNPSIAPRYVFSKSYALIQLVFIEETLPDPAAARSSYRDARADSLMSTAVERAHVLIQQAEALG